MPRDEVWRGPLAPQRRKQDGPQDRNASHHSGQIPQVSCVWMEHFGLQGQMSLVPGLGA